MSTCGNCDCADKSQCVKKGNTVDVEIVNTERSFHDGAGMGTVAESGSFCKCGPSCACTDCRCGH